jgi:hypothetical protein
MLIRTWFRRALVAAALSAVACGAMACSSSTEEPVGTTSSSLTVAPLGARDRSAFTKQAGSALRADKGGKFTKNGVVYAAAPGAAGRWGFAVIEADGSLSGFRFVDAKSTAPKSDASGVRPATLHALDDQGGGGGGGSACNQSACNAATSAAAAAFADFVAASDDEWTALAFGLVWYAREVDKENACSSCG